MKGAVPEVELPQAPEVSAAQFKLQVERMASKAEISPSVRAEAVDGEPWEVTGAKRREREARASSKRCALLDRVGASLEGVILLRRQYSHSAARVALDD